MSSLKEQVNKTAVLLNDIKVALEDQGVDTSNMTPKDYANAIRGVVNNITIDNISLIPVLIFKYSENRPDRPDGGSWNPETGETLVPEGWYTDIGLDYNASNKSLTLWMSNAVFSSNGDLYKKWSTPIRISGRDGQDGKQGPEGLPGTVAGVTQFFNYPIFYRGTSDQPDTPWAEYDPIENELQIQNGWTETIERTDNAGVVYWQSYVKYNTANMPPATCTTPIRMTAESSAVTGNIRYYQLSTSRSTPAKGTSSWKKWTEEIDIAPTKTQPYLFCYDETIYGESRKTTSPVYLMATYTLGLLDIDIAYAVGQENTVKKRDGESDSEYNERFGKFWFTDSVEAISADKNKEKHPDDENFNYYPGLTERTTYLWCRETFEYNDHVEQFYRVISYYKAAEKAPVLYSAGVYSDLVYYTRNDEQCPYIFYPTGLYLDESENVITKTEDGKDVPVTDNDSPTDGKKYQYFFLKNSYENNEVFDSFYEAYLNKKWKKIDSFEAIYSDIGIFKSALVGKFVFDDKYMFSMFGKGFIDNNSSGTIKMEYTNFTDTKGKIWDDSEGKWKTREGVATAIDAAVHGAEADKKFIPGTLINAVTGESWFANGNTRFYYDGEGDLAGGAIAWRYDNDESEKPTLYIDGDVKIGTRAKDHVYDTSIAISDAKSFNDVVSEQVTIKNMVEKVQDQIDGVVENYFEEGAPTTKNKPVTDWIAASDDDDDDYALINHVGDTYTNIQEYVNDEKTPDAGKSWRWCWCNDASITDKIAVTDKEGITRHLHWHPIADSDAVKALLKASKAQDAASAVSTRITNWASDNYISPLEKTELKKEFTFVQKDYEEIIKDANRYGVASTVFTSAYNDYYGTLKSIVDSTRDLTPVGNLVTHQTNYYGYRSILLQNIASTSKTKLDDAYEKAEGAKMLSETANKTLSAWTADGYFSPMEMNGIYREWKTIASEYKDIKNEVEKWNTDKLKSHLNNYKAAYDEYDLYLTTIVESYEDSKLKDPSGAILVPEGFNAAVSNYYYERANIKTELAYQTVVGITDMDYLSNTFESVVANDGVNLSKAIFVATDPTDTNEDGSIGAKAMLNGSSSFKDADDEDLIVFAGGISESGASLVEKVQNASSLIYESGTISVGGGGKNAPIVLNNDGSGHLARENIHWTKDGTLFYTSTKVIDWTDWIYTNVWCSGTEKIYDIDIGTADTIVFLSKLLVPSTVVATPKTITINIKNVTDLANNRAIKFIFCGDGLMPRYIKTDNSHTFLSSPTGYGNSGITRANNFNTVSKKYDASVTTIDILFYNDSGTIRVITF